MAERYTRRITLWINDKEVRNDISSIRKEMYKLQSQQAHMIRGSKEYNAKTKQIKQLRGIMKQHNAQLRDTQKGWFNLSKAADKFNRYWGIATAALASFAGAVFTIKSAIQSYSEFDDKLADVMKTTGLTKDRVVALNEELEKINTRTSQVELLNLARVAGKLGITVEEEILGFVKAADQIAVALGEDLGGTEDAVRELGKLTDIFKIKETYGMEESLLKIGSAINELGMASTANEAYLVEFSKRTAGIAPQAGVSVQNILGLAATLDALGQKAEMSSTAYSKLMTTMTKKTSQFASIAGMGLNEFTKLMEQDANEAMIRVFEGINKTDGGFQQMVSVLGDLGVEGQRMTSVFGALANNTEMLREQQQLSNKAFEEGTSLTNEFNIKNNTAQANLEKARKNFAELARELGKKLIPAYTSVISKSRLLLEFFLAFIDIISKYGKTIIISTAAIAAYTIAVKLAARWDKIHYGYLVAQNAVKKSAAFFTGILTGKIKLATVAQKAWNLAQKANPIGLILGIIVAAGTALYMYSKRLTAAEKAQKELNNVEKIAKQNIVEQKLGIEKLLRTAKNEKLSLDKRKKALEELNKISPEYFGNLKLEKINTQEAEEATKNYTKALLDQARVEAAKEKLIELEKERIEALAEGTDTQISFFEKIKKGYTVAGAIIDLFGKRESTLRKEQKWGDEKANQAAANYNKTKEALIGLIDKETKAIKNQKNEIGDSDKTEFDSPLSSSNFETVKKALESAFTREQNLLKQQLLEKKLTKAQFNQEMYSLELAHLTAMRELYRRHGEDFISIEGQIIDKKLAWQQELDKILEISTQITEKITGDERKMFADIDKEMDEHLANYKKNLDDETESTVQAKIKQKEALEAAKEAAILYAVESGAAAVDSAETIEEAGKAVLNVIRDQIKAYLAQSVAAQVSKILKLVPPPFSLILAAAAGAAASALFNQIVPKFYSGGYTEPGPPNQPAGIVHKGEYVVSQQGLQNPQVRQLVDHMELARRAGSLSTFDIRPLIDVIPSPGYAQGGYTGQPAPSPSSPAVRTLTADPELKELIKENIKATREFMKWKPKVYSEIIKRDLETLDEIEQQRGF